MAASQPGASSLAQKADNRIFLFRLQMLIIDGGLTSLRNYVDQKLAAQSTTLSVCLANEKANITLLKGRKIITQMQYDLLYPSSGTVSTSDLDFTLIICLMRNLKCFKTNSKFNWNIPPVQNDTSIEADICRLRKHRNKICHTSTTTGIQHNDFINMWNEIEEILLRIDKVHPIKDFKQTITDFQCSAHDPNIEKRLTDEIEKWKNYELVETALVQLKKGHTEIKHSIETQTIELDEFRKRMSEDKEELTEVNVNYQQRKQDGMKMTPESVRKVIVKHFDALKKYMHPDPIIDCKTDFNLLSFTDRWKLKGKDIIYKNHTILNKIRSTGVNGYEDFKERLKKTWQIKLLELIQCEENGQDTKEIEDQLEKNAVLSPEYVKPKMDEELKWKDCIKKEDVKAAREMLDGGNLPSPEELQFVVNNFTYSNETREIVKDICQRIEILLQEEHEEIEYIKGCYKHDDPYKNVIFVIKTSKPIRSRYRLYEVEQNNKETTKEMEGENCPGYQSEEMFQRACECLRMKSPGFMEAHSNLTRTSVRPVKLRKLQPPDKAVCIVFYVEVKGYIPIGENALPEQIKHDDDTAFVTDVREGQCATAIAGPCDKHDDLKIGCKIVSNTDAEGTLGCFVNHPKDGLCAMSCAHVFLTVEAMKEVYNDKEKQNVESLGTIKCFQPGEPDLCGEVCDIRLFGNKINCGMDIAFFKVDETRKPKTTTFPDVFASRIPPSISNGIEMRYNPKSVMQNSKTMEMTLSTQVVKYGMKSNLTSGTYQCSGGSVRLEVSGKRPRPFPYVLADQIEIRDKTGKFCKPGDSGAMVFVIDKNKHLMALGILTGRIMRDKTTYVTPIWNILKEIEMPLPYVLAEPI